MNKRNTMQGEIRRAPMRGAGIIVLILNILFFSCAFVFYTLYTNAYEERLRVENLGNIANMNRSSALNATALLDSWNIKLNDLAQNAERNSLSLEETLRMIENSNSSDERFFELIGRDSKGFLAQRGADGKFLPLDYTDQSYSELQSIFKASGGSDGTGIRFAPEFTDGGASGSKVFAIYRYVTLLEGEEKLPYTLMLATDAGDILARLNSQNDFTGQSTVLIDENGNYIVKSLDFKSTNFFQYLYVYNDLSLDQKNAVKSEMQEKGSGELYFKNAGVSVEDCVYRYERLSGSGWYCITSVPLSSFHAPVLNSNYVFYAIAALLLVLVIDVTWLQGMNRRLRASMIREKEASAAKGNFMSRMSHEIRTPLNAVIGYNTIARNEISDAKDDRSRRHAEMKVLDCLTKSDIASRHLLTIINDVLDMSAIESGKIKVSNERFDFKGLITSITTIFYSQARAKNVELEVVFDNLTEEWYIGDQVRVNQILTNLLSNAVKFTPEGGKVRLTIHLAGSDEKTAHIHFSVADSGIGMSKEYLGRIFMPFEQADSSISRRFGGTGLGLSITKNLVDIMNGKISVSSELGKGTTFEVDLDFGRAVQLAADEAYDFSYIKALIVDDDPSTCDYIKLLFGRCGARCAAVNSGAAAIEAFETAAQMGEGFTMCLVDWHMPSMDGIETIKRLHSAAKSDIPFVVLTAYDYSEIADMAEAAGVNRFIGKPLFQSSLFDLLAGLSGGQTHLHIQKNKKYDFGGKRVLLVEDNAMNMEIAKKIMESAGLVVDEAWNGREAVEKYGKAEAGYYMAILMDVHMPEMNGHEAARTIRAMRNPEAKTIPIIAMTADAFAENVAEAKAAGMNEHIAKPIDIPTLFETLSKYA